MTPVTSASKVQARAPHLRLLGEPQAPSSSQLIDDAKTAERQGRREEARALYEHALRRLPRDGSQAVLASALVRWIARTHETDANLDAASDCVEAALAVAEQSGDEAAIGHTINLQAIVHWQQGRLDDAERLYVKARESALRSGETKLAAMTAQNLGVIANVRGDFLKALRHYEISLADYRALGLVKDVCVALNNLGLLYTDMQRWESAERAYEEAVQISTALGDLSVRVQLEVNVAEMWAERGNFDRARESCDRAMDLSRQIQDTTAHGEAHKVYGIIARETGSYAVSEEHLVRAEQLAAERQDLLLQAETARERAELHRRQGRSRDTLQCLNRAHRLFSKFSARRELADVDRRTLRLEGDFLEVVRRWSESIESKDHYTQGHCERVADVACALAVRAGMDQRSLFWFRIGALLHDVGKLIIPSEVLNKPGKLTEEEWTLVKRHPIAGIEMLAQIEFPWDVRPLVESHHERWDGAGYPHGLAGDEIPFAARILCIADVYDALTSQRSYKRAFTHEEAMRIMRAEVGHQFDPALFAHFEDVMRAGAPARAVSPILTGAHVPAPRPPRPAGTQLDELTGLPLRRAFMERAADALSEHRASGAALSLLVLDVDRFKQVNDTFGHLQGDAVLRFVGESLRATVGDAGFIARYAGDEFVILLPRTSLDDARTLAERVRAAVQGRRCPLRNAEDGAITLTLSIGVAAFPQHGEKVEALFAAADHALYEAKRRGRNAVAVATGPDADLTEPRLTLDRFVGRQRELDLLIGHLESTLRGAPKVVAVLGEAGVGKSTLLRQLAPEVRMRAGSLVLGRCHEADVRSPYGPWASVLGAIRLLGVVPDRPWRELPRLVGGLAGQTSVDVTERASSKYVLLNELTEYLRLASASRPLVVVLDDMQWADTASWDTLEYLVQQLESERLLICLTVRTEEAREETAARRLRLRQSGRFEELSLPRLSRDEMRLWMASAFQRDDVERDLLGFLYRHTEGNPLFVVQVLRTLVDEGLVWHSGQRWEWRPIADFQLPVGVSDLISRRLAQLSPKSHAVLTTAAVIGRSFDIELAVAAGAGTEDAVLDAIDAGVAAAVIEPVGGDGGDRFTFAHALLVDAIRRSANPRRVARIHERVARAMEERHPGAAAEIAAHYDQAGNGEKAYQYALLAGTRAAGVYAHDDATAFFTMAQRHASTPAQLAEARLRLAQVAEAAGGYAHAEALCDQVLEHLANTSDVARTISVRRMRERLRVLQGQPPQLTLDTCRVLLTEAEEAQLEGERVALLTMVSQAQTRLGDWTSAEAIARECVAMAEGMGDARLLADALGRLGTTLLETQPAEAIGLYRQALDVFTVADDRYGQVRCRINIGVAHSRAGNGAAAEEAYEMALDLARSAHAPDLGGLASLNLGVLYVQSGRYEQATERFEEALRLFTTVRNEPRRLATLYNMAHLARERGDTSAALDLYDAAAELARSVGQTVVEIGAFAGAGLAWLQLGEPSIAGRSLDAANAMIGKKHDWWFQGRELVEALAVRLALFAGDSETAAGRFHFALTHAEHHDLYGAAWLVAECAGPLSACAGSLVEVREAVLQYAPQARAMGYVPLSARYAAFEAREERTA